MARPIVRKSGPERREEIAQATLRILGRSGLAGLTMADLAAEVGLTSGALFRHFPDRAAILAEAVRLAVTRADETFPRAELPPLERLAALARARITLLRAEPGVAWLLRSGQALTMLPPTAVAELRALVRRSRGFIRDALAEATEAGSARTDIAPDVLLVIFTATVHALVPGPGLQRRGARATSPDEAVQGLLTLLAPCPAPSP
ncbi:MAG: TetR/AcrR family transcriptional regulator [Planctomycetota bacterium]|nr:TetR/AcrR family transcriptional regulator [Planctomycetota bacterium]